jgi:hypothetical protein
MERRLVRGVWTGNEKATARAARPATSGKLLPLAAVFGQIESF